MKNKNMKIIRNTDDLRQQIKVYRAEGLTVALVPTMGALHEGHLSLIRMARAKADKVCVSIFVNPRQFGPTEDFDIYPRNEERDIKLLQLMSTDLLYAPDVDEIYPETHSTSIQVGPIGDILEGEYRPGFFTGVATIVAKLLMQCQPDVAIFGEKDFQQLQVIRKLVTDLNIPSQILGCETIRESDGLALSSRNAYLSEDEREIAPELYKTLCQVADAANGGGDVIVSIMQACDRLEQLGYGPIDYLAVRDVKTLQHMPDGSEEGRVLVAANLGKTRLIDNIAI